jgi:NAD+ diphosphatase
MSFVPGALAPDIVSAQPIWFLVHDAGLIVQTTLSGPRLPRRSDVIELGFDPDHAHYLGRSNGEDCFALHVENATLPAPWSAQGLRALYAGLGDDLFLAAGRAVQIATFSLTHRHCGRCGRATQAVPGEHSVRCEGDNLTFYPRIAPAIIVLVRRGEQALLARSARFPAGMYSTLAGFVEPGESLEQTLSREVREEVGIEVDNIRYFSSQPWPFPHSLMVGFTAEHAGGELRADGVEIVDARWFSPNELPNLPPKPSIARRLIDETWLRVVSRPRGLRALDPLHPSFQGRTSTAPPRRGDRGGAILCSPSAMPPG